MKEETKPSGQGSAYSTLATGGTELPPAGRCREGCRGMEDDEDIGNSYRAVCNAAQQGGREGGHGSSGPGVGQQHLRHAWDWDAIG